MIVFMYIRQREPAKIVSKEWKLTIVFLRGLNVVSPDGNGRTTRAFANMLLLKRNVSPVFFRDKEKDEYKEALKVADLSGQYDMLYERFFKSILSSFGALSDFRM